jgi:hypothetical protein
VLSGLRSMFGISIHMLFRDAVSIEDVTRCVMAWEGDMLLGSSVTLTCIREVLGPSTKFGHSWVRCVSLWGRTLPRLHHVTTYRVGGSGQVPAEITTLPASVCYCWPWLIKWTGGAEVWARPPLRAPSSRTWWPRPHSLCHNRAPKWGD